MLCSGNIIVIMVVSHVDRVIDDYQCKLAGDDVAKDDISRDTCDIFVECLLWTLNIVINQ